VDRGNGIARDASSITLFLCGDVMTGRGIDQILRHPSDPALHESCARSALDYVTLAERRVGPLPRRVESGHIWGDALSMLAEMRPDARIVNLETAVTTHARPWPGKGIHYRMHPANIDCLQAAALDCCVLANNHVLDWGREGLAQTLATLRGAGLRTAGAGADLAEAAAPAVVDVRGKGRVLVFAYGLRSSGIPSEWAASASRAGVHLLDDLTRSCADGVVRHVREHRRPGDLVVVSLHWGGNWEYRIHGDERRFARTLVESGAVDVLHGHSSHHPKGIEVHEGRLILYGCGDFLDDYEGIGAHEGYRSELGLAYFPELEIASGRLLSLRMVPTRIERFRVNRASLADASWAAGTLDRESRALGSRIERCGGELRLVPG
jgi:poly-gamma-glutamate synthesis protein (capsule biosynthesis protein)